MGGLTGSAVTGDTVTAALVTGDQVTGPPVSPVVDDILLIDDGGDALFIDDVAADFRLLGQSVVPNLFLIDDNGDNLIIDDVATADLRLVEN